MNKRVINFIIAFLLMTSIIDPSLIAHATGKKALDPLDDSRGHNALTWTVQGISSTAALQAFVVGWNLTFTSGGKSITVYVPRSMDYWGSDAVVNVFPLTDRWESKSFPMHGIGGGGNSVLYFASKMGKTARNTYEEIITSRTGCQIEANAKIQKYTFDSDRNPKYQATSSANPNNFADSLIEIDANFKEFTSEFRDNAKDSYFNIRFALPPEAPKVITPNVTLTRPQNGTTVLQGTTVTFKGTGTGCHHIGGFLDGKFYGIEQYNSNEDITSEMTYETTVRLDEVRDYTFQIKGRNTGQETDEGSVLTESSTSTVHVIAPPPDSGYIYIRCIDYDTEKEIKDTSQTIPGVKYGQATIVDISNLDQSIISKYEFKGSCQTLSETIPDKSKIIENKSQTITLLSTNKTAYVYFWLKQKEPKPPISTAKPPTVILNNTAVAYAGDDVSFDGSQSYDTDGTITGYSWSLPGSYENNSVNGSEGKTWYEREGSYSIGLTVTDDSGLIASASGYVKILPPKPNVVLNASAAKMKENRKITFDLLSSTSPSKYPIDWSLTTWNIEVVQDSGGTEDYGVRLEDGKVYKNSEGKAQLYERGKWKETGLDFNSILTGQKTIQFQARDSGQYKITATLTNSASFDRSLHNSNSTVKTINIVEDLAPVADFLAPDNNVREHESLTGVMVQKFGIIPITCTTGSPDGDTIGVRKWSLRYDSDNDGSFADEKTVYPYIGDEPFTGGLRLVVNGDSDSVCEIWSYEVGSYTESLQAFEAIPDNETLTVLLISEDYKCSYVNGW